MKLSAEELTALTRYQIGALKAFLDAEDVPLHHVKVWQSFSWNNIPPIDPADALS